MAHNKLTPSQAERLALLLEELGEAQQSIGKILRFGYDSHDPAIDAEMTNRFLLENELGNVRAAMHLMFKAGDLNEDMVTYHKEDKLKRVGEFLHHQGATS